MPTPARRRPPPPPARRPLALLLAFVGAWPSPAGASSTTAAAALAQAEACFAELDYLCAEQQVSLALAEPLSPADEVRARTCLALLALAYHDETRARRAVADLLAVAPGFRPAADAPPRLVALVAERRRQPASRWSFAPSLRVGLGGVAALLVGNDAQRWEDGLGGSGRVGLRLNEAGTAVEAVLGYVDHASRDFYMRQLGVGHGSLRLRQRILGEQSVRLELGIGLGGARIDAEGLTGRSQYWGGLFELPVELAWNAWHGLTLVAGGAPTLLVVEDRERAAFSLLFPLSIGVCYQR